jgi:hypothetical protein
MQQLWQTLFNIKSCAGHIIALQAAWFTGLLCIAVWISFYVKEKQQTLDALFGINLRKKVSNTKFNTEATSRVMICYSPLFHVSIAINVEEYYKLDVTKLVLTKTPNISYNMRQLRIEFCIYFHLLPAYLLLYLKIAMNSDMLYFKSHPCYLIFVAKLINKWRVIIFHLNLMYFSN